jgi:LuxR family transcriptional activator of conjugal transfer of Ti plasmids
MSDAILPGDDDEMGTIGTGVRGVTIGGAGGYAMPAVLNRIAISATAADLRKCIVAVARSIGLAGGRYIHIGHGLIDHERSKGERPARFLSTWDQEGAPEMAAWLSGDPVATQVRSAFAPFAWSTRPSAGVNEVQAAWLADARARGIRAGIAVPVQDYSAGPAYLSIAGDDEAAAREMVEQRAPDLAYIGVQIHARAKLILSLSDRAHVQTSLTRREIDCLRLAALGRTVAETGQALGITGRTVEFHLKNAAQKLGAPSKVRAVALAVSRGLIDF